MKRTPFVLATLAAVALLAAGCGKDDAIPASAGAPTTSTSAGDDTTSSSTGGSTTTTAAGEEGDTGASDTDAAKLRADLAALLEEHTYLTGITVTQLVAQGATGPGATAAAAALNANSDSLGDVVSSGFDPDVGEDFLRLWRGHVTDYVDYANARITNAAAAADAATSALDTFASDTGELFEKASDKAVSADQVSDGLDTHVQGALAAIDATVAGSPDAVTLLREAASHGPDAAEVWARGMTSGDEA